jgi:hypothetical protein
MNSGGYQGAMGGIDPVNVANPTMDLNNYQQFFDTTTQAFNRNLDPQWEQREARFNQDMVNRGFTQGSEGYNAARADFDRGRNDAYTSATAAAQQSALGAQQQFWGQNYNESQLANALAQSRMSADAGITQANIGAGASMYGDDINRQNFMDNLGLQRDQFGYQQDRGDMQDLMALYGMGNEGEAYNNNLLNQDYGRGGDFMNLIPGVSGQGLNVGGALNQQNQANYNNSNAAYQASQAQQQQYMQLAGMMASMFMSSKDAKVSLGPLEPVEDLAALNSLPVDRWQYKHNGDIHVGPYAEDFNEATSGTKLPTISVIDMLGTLVAGVQEITRRLTALEAKNA